MPLWSRPEIIAAGVSAVVSGIVSLAVGPWRARREEAARDDRTARVAVARHLKTLHLRLIQERRRRNRLARGDQPRVRQQRIQIWEVEHLAWPALHALDEPTLNRRVAADTRARLIGLLGEERVEYLEASPEAPASQVVSYRDVTERVMETGFRADNELSDAPADLMVQDDDVGVASALQRMINALNEMIERLT